MNQKIKKLQALLQRRQELKQTGIYGHKTELLPLAESIRESCTANEELLSRFASRIGELEDIAIDLRSMLREHEDRRLLYADEEHDPDETRSLLSYIIASLYDIKRGFSDEDPDEDESWERQQDEYHQRMTGVLPANDDVIEQQSKVKGVSPVIGAFEGYAQTPLVRSRQYAGSILVSSPPEVAGRVLALSEMTRIKYIEKSTQVIVALERMYRFELHINPDWTCEALIERVLGLALQEVQSGALEIDPRRLKSSFLWHLMLSNREVVPNAAVLRPYLWSNAGCLFLVAEE